MILNMQHDIEALTKERESIKDQDEGHDIAHRDRYCREIKRREAIMRWRENKHHKINQPRADRREITWDDLGMLR
jgi:hypothetical protein